MVKKDIFCCYKVPSAQSSQSQKHNVRYKLFLTVTYHNYFFIDEIKNFKAKYLYFPDDIIIIAGVKIFEENFGFI